VSVYRAFGSEAGKQALKADIRAKGPVYAAWLTEASLEGDLTPVSEQHGLHPALVRLLPALGAFGQGDEAPAFYEALLEAIPVGAETGHLARRAVLLAWTEPVYGRAHRIAAGPVREACEAIVALVRRSIESPVDKPTWRAARTRLTQAQRQDPAPEPVVDLMLSMAWDLEQSPGAAQDGILAWTAHVSAEAEAAHDDPFSETEAAFYRSTMDRINEEAFAAISDANDPDDADLDAFLADANRRWAADPLAEALKERALKKQGRIKAKLAAWRAVVRQQVLEDAAALAV
jgi:hypothetical protein